MLIFQGVTTLGLRNQGVFLKLCVVTVTFSGTKIPPPTIVTPEHQRLELNKNRPIQNGKNSSEPSIHFHDLWVQHVIFQGIWGVHSVKYQRAPKFLRPTCHHLELPFFFWYRCDGGYIPWNKPRSKVRIPLHRLPHEGSSVSINYGMGPNPNGAPSKLLGRAIRYSGFFGVRSVGPVGDFLDSVIWHQSIISQSSVGGW